jgi:hypothetical protein
VSKIQSQGLNETAKKGNIESFMLEISGKKGYREETAKKEK